MKPNIEQSALYKKIVDEQNIFSAIFCLESYVFEKGLLDTTEPVSYQKGDVEERIANNDLELYYALSDKYNAELIGNVINACKLRLEKLFSDKENLFTTTVYFKLKSYDVQKE